MEQNITIKVPKGKIAKYNEKTHVIEFFDEGPARSKSWKEFCKNHKSTKDEYFITDDGDIQKITKDYGYRIRRTEFDANKNFIFI